MKKIVVLLLMLTSFFAFSCGGGGEQDILERNVLGLEGNDVTDLRDDKDEQEDVRNILIFHPDETLVGSDVTDLREYRKDIPIFGKFMEVLSTANTDGTLVGSDVNSGWVTYRWKDGSETDCDGDYKISYLERVSDNRFVGGGMCLLNTKRGNWWRLYYPNDGRDRFINLWKLVHTAMVSINNIADTGTVNTDIICNDYHTDRIGNPGPPATLTSMFNESGELYLFLGQLKGNSAPRLSVTVRCHTDGTLLGSNAYGFTDDFGREYIKEVADELADLDPRNWPDRGLIDEGIWNTYTVPKPGQRNTSSDPPKLSYFRISSPDIYGRRYIAGAGFYLDVNNPNVDPDNPTRLEEIRNRVSEAAELLRGKEGEELTEALEDNREYFTNDNDPEAYIFVWENRPE